MEGNCEENSSLGFHIEDMGQNSENNTDNDYNKSEQQNIYNNNQMNDQNFGSNNDKNYMNENYDCNNNIHIQYNKDKQNFMEDLNSGEIFHNKNSNEVQLGGDIFYNNSQNISQNDNKKTAPTNNNNTMNNSKKQINTINEQISVVLNELYNVKEVNLETKHDMQLLKKKKKRRTRKQIELDQKKEGIKIENVPKQLGRKKKESNYSTSKHSKKSDDNIMKKINSFYLESVRNWLNNSFLDEKGFFEPEKVRAKLKKPLFLKIKPNLITTNLKKSSVVRYINKQFKEILSNEISCKYSTIQKDENKKLIDKIYKDNNQPFILYILDSTFIDILDYFTGQNNGENIKNYFANMKISEQMVEEFLNKFSKIKDFLSKINEKEKDNNNLIESQDYIERISLLCINYREWFAKKFERKNGKKKICK